MKKRLIYVLVVLMTLVFCICSCVTQGSENNKAAEVKLAKGSSPVMTLGAKYAGDPIMKSGAGDPIMRNAAGDPIMFAGKKTQGGDPIMYTTLITAGGDPIMMDARGNYYKLNASGELIKVNAAGDPIMENAAGAPIK